MNKEFIPYEEALDLKELGFNEPCIEYVRVDRNPQVTGTQSRIGTTVALPLYQQAFRWFREKFNLASQIHPLTLSGQFIWHYLIRDISEYLTEFDLEKFTFNTYEEAELACLKKLIEIAKSK